MTVVLMITSRFNLNNKQILLRKIRFSKEQRLCKQRLFKIISPTCYCFIQNNTIYNQYFYRSETVLRHIFVAISQPIF